MKIFIIVIIVATIIGGFVGGEQTGQSFSLTGAVIGGLGFASVLLALGAYFDSQDKKISKKEAPKEMHAVFERMHNLKKDLKQPLNSSNKIDDRKEFFLTTVYNLLAVQLLPKYKNPKDVFSELMTNKKASGYLFGFHDALIQKLGIIDSSPSVIEQSYKKIFGESAGYTLYSMSINSLDIEVFHKGRMDGGNEIVDYLDKNIPPLGLGRILILYSQNQELEEVEDFVKAMLRLNPDSKEDDMRKIARTLTPNYDSPYLAALDAFITILEGVVDNGNDKLSVVGVLTANGSSAICEFVIEEKVSYKDGKTYFNQVMEFINFILPPGLKASGLIMDFDEMLELHKSRYLK